MGAVAASGLFLVAAVADVGGIVVVLIPLWLVLGLSGIAMPNAPAIALSMPGEAADTAAALIGAVRFGVGAAPPPFVGLLGTDAIAMAIVASPGIVLALGPIAHIDRSPPLPSSPSGRSSCGSRLGQDRS